MGELETYGCLIELLTFFTLQITGFNAVPLYLLFVPLPLGTPELRALRSSELTPGVGPL